MNLIIWTITWIIGSTLFLWAFYWLIQKLDRWAIGRTGLPKGIVTSISNAFWIADYIYNLTTGTMVFLEFPAESPETFSTRLRRHYYPAHGTVNGYGWRRYLAGLFRTHVNNIEAGHI